MTSGSRRRPRKERSAGDKAQDHYESIDKDDTTSHKAEGKGCIRRACRTWMGARLPFRNTHQERNHFLGHLAALIRSRRIG